MKKTTERRIMITGIAPVGQWGTTKHDLMNCLMAKNNLSKKIPDSFLEHSSYASQYYVPFPELSLDDFNIHPYYKRILADEDKLAVIATLIAFIDAGFEVNPDGKKFKIDGIESPDVFLGIGFSGLQNSFHSFLSHIKPKDESPAKRFNRLIIPMTMPNSIAAWVSIIYNLKGESKTVNASCASGTAAIGNAFRQIKDGYNDIVVTGGIENLRDETGSIFRGFDNLSALSVSPDGKSTPFSKNRSGFLFSEGAGCVLILEELEHVKARGGNIYAEIVDYQANSDAHNIVQLNEDGQQIKYLLTNLIKDEKIDYINAHGTGTILNDNVESKVIQEIFGDKENQPIINATKGIIGHSIGATGAIETAVTALSLFTGLIHGNDIPDPIENLNILADAVDTKIKTAITTSYGFGGHNCVLLMKKYEK